MVETPVIILCIFSSCLLFYNSYLTGSNFDALFRPTCGTTLPQASCHPSLLTGHLPQLHTPIPPYIYYYCTSSMVSTNLSVCCLNSSIHPLILASQGAAPSLAARISSRLLAAIRVSLDSMVFRGLATAPELPAPYLGHGTLPLPFNSSRKF